MWPSSDLNIRSDEGHGDGKVHLSDGKVHLSDGFSHLSDGKVKFRMANCILRMVSGWQRRLE